MDRGPLVPCSSLSVLPLLRPEPEVKPKYTILSKSVASWFLEHKHVYISEATIQAATEAAETVARHHIKLPPLDFSTIDLGACRAALKAKQEAEKMVQLQMNNAPKKEEGEANPHAKSYQLLSSLGPSLETWMARISPVLPISSPTREQQAHDMPLRRTSLAGSIAASSGMPSPSRFNPALASTRAHRASSNGQPQGHGPVRCSVNGAPVRQSGLSGPPRQSMSGAPRQSMCGGTSAVQYGIDGLPTGPSRKVSESGSINERVRHSSNRQEGSINHRTLTIETFFEADGPYPFDVQRARASRLPSYQTCAGLDLDAIAAPHSREVMRCGVSLAFLQYFSAFVENSNDTSVWTTRHVVEKFVKPRTKKTVCRYCDTLPDGVAGNPRFLVSHRWDSIFSNMVKQVSTHFKGQDPERIFLFIDIFSLKQHKKEETSTDQATLTMLKDVVTNVQQTLIVLDRDGLVLRRVWVLYEAWLTLIAHPSLPRCVCVLGFGIQWSPLLQELVCTLDIMKAEASNSGDLALILKDMKEGSTGGMGAANRLVKEAVNASAARETHRLEKFLTPNSPISYSLWVGWRVQQSIFCRILGDAATAEELLWGTLETMMSANRGELEDLSFLVSALTDLLIQSRVPQRIQAACALCRLVQDRMERHLGTENEASLQVAASHTRALKESDSIQSAEQLGRAVLIRREGQDASTLDLMDSLVDLGQICMTLGQGMEDEAEELILRAVGLGQETFGSLTHPWCIPAIHALSLLYQTKGQHGDAAAWLVQTRVAMSKVYNADSNPFILATLQLSMSMEHLEDLATAEKLLRRLVGLAEDAEGGRVLPGPPKASKPVLMFAAPSVGLTLEPPKSPLIGSHSLRSKLEGHRMSSLSPPRTSSLLSGPGRDAGKRSQSRERAGSITQPYHRSSTGPDKGRSPTPRSPSYQDGNGNASPSTLPRSLQGSRNSSPSSPSRYLKDGEKSSPRASPSMGRGGRNSQGESRQLPPELQAARPAFTPPSSAERLLSPRKLQNKLNGLMFTVLCRLASVIVEGVKAQTTKAPAIEATPSASVTSSKWQQNSSKADKGKQRSLENVDLVHPSSSHTHNTRRKSLSGTTGAHAYIQDTALANEVTARIILHPDESGNADGQPAQEDGGGSGEMNPEVPAMIDGGGDGMHPPHHRLPSAKDLQRITRDDYDSSDMEADGVGLLGTEVLQLQSEVVGQPDNLDSLTFSPKRLDSPHAPSSAQLSLAVTVDSLDVGEGRQGAILTGTIFPTMCEENGETILQEESSNRRLRASTSILLRVDKSREIREQIESGMKEEDERTDSLRRGIKPGNSVVGEIDFGRISQLGTQEILPLPGLPTDTPVEGVDVSAVPRGDKQTPFKTQSKTVQRDPQEVFVELAVIVRQLLGMFDEEMRSARAAIVAAEKEKELQKLSKGERTIKKREEMREEQGFYNPNKASKGGFIGSHQKAALGAYPLRGTQRFLDAGGVTNPEQRKFKVRQRDPAAAGQDREGAKSPGANGNGDKAGQHKSNQMSGGFEGGRRAGGSPGRRTLAQVATKSHRTLLPSLNGHQNKQRSEATSGGHQSAQAEAHAMPWTSLKDALAEAPMSSVAKERRAMLKELELKLKQRGAMLQKQGDENSASSVLQQGLYIMLHLEGPGSDDALSAVATVVDMLVAKRRFAEARMQLNQQLSLPGMTLTNKHLLKTRVQKYMTEAAFKAAEAEDTETCLEALGLGAKPTLDDRNLLVLSASLGNREICQALLSLDPHLVDSYERRSTMTALIAASEGGHGSIVEDLIAVKRSGVDAGDLKGRSGLHYTALRGHQRVTKLLLAARANINIRDGVLRSTPLMLASEAGHLGVVQILLEMGAQADFLDNNSRSSLILACIAQRSDVVSVLLSCRCRLSIQDKDGRTALSYACEQGDLENVSSLILARADLELPNSCNVTPLMLAARGGHARIVDLLLKQSVGSESKDNSGRTALMYGAAEGHVDVCASLISNCMKHSERSEAQARLLDAKLEAETKKQNAMVQSKVDEALARVGVKIVIEPTPPLTPDVDLVEDDEEEEEEEEEDNGKGLSVLEKLSRSRRILPKVRQFVSIFDKFGCSAADLASENGHRELAMLLRNIMMSNLERSSMKLQEMEAVGSQDLEPLPETMS